VWPLFVVADDPLSRHSAHLIERFEYVAVEYLLAIGSVEALDQRILHRFAGLNESELDIAVTFCPIRKRVADQFRPVVQAV
jgi:hypothetical protein